VSHAPISIECLFSMTHLPGILGSPYVAPLGPGRLLVGATKEFGATATDARRAGEVNMTTPAAAATAINAGRDESNYRSCFTCFDWSR